MLVTQAEFAELRGVTQAYVSKLKKQKKIVMTDGKVDVEASLKKLGKEADPARAMVIAAKEEPDVGDDAAEPLLQDGDNESYATSRAKREQFLARMAELEYNRKVGLYLDKEEVVDAMVQAGRKIRQRLEGIIDWSDEIAAQAAAGAGAEDIRKFLKVRVRQLQQQTSDTLAEQKIQHNAAN